MMLFTKQEVEKQYSFLKSSTSYELRNKANLYLIEFQKSIESLYISNELLESSNIEIQFLGSQVLYQKIKEKIVDFYSNKEELMKYRQTFLNTIIERVNKSPQIVLERLCYGVSIIMTLGILSFWNDCVEDIITFGKLSTDNCLLSLIILENIPKEWSEIHISNKNHLKIRDLFKEKVNIVNLYVTELLQQCFSLNDTNLKNSLIEKIFTLIISWIKFGINIFKNSEMSELVLKHMNENNMKLISNIFAESCCKSECSRIYEDQEKYDLPTILQLIDKETYASIEKTIMLINSYMTNLLNEKNLYQNYNLINYLSIIFSYIIENFIFILFQKTNISDISLILLYNLSTMKIKKISQKLFEIFREMREFINKGFKLANFTDEEKKSFCDYLINLCLGVLANSKLDTLKIEDTKVLNSTDDLNDDDEYKGEQEISCAEFRKFSGDLFCNVFVIFSSNFSIEGENYFFSKFMQVIEESNKLYEHNKDNQEYLLITEVVIFFVRNLVQAMYTDNHYKFIIQFVKAIIKSNALNNEKILHSFILLIKESTNIIPIDKETFLLIIQFLSNLINNTNLNCIACEVLLSISSNLSAPNIECFQFCYKIYQEKYDSLTNNSLIELTESLCNFLGILDKENNILVQLNNQEVFQYFSLIMKPAIIKIKDNCNILMNNQVHDTNRIKLDFLRSFGILNSILTKSFNLNMNLMEDCFVLLMNESILYTEAIYKMFSLDTNFIKEMNNFFCGILKNVQSKAVDYFDKLNDIFITSYFTNCDNILSLEILGYLYSNVIAYSNEKKQIVSKNFQFLGSRILDNIVDKNNYKLRIELLEIFAHFIIRITETINYLYIDKQFMDRLIHIYLEAIQSITEPNLNRTIVKLFYYIISFHTVFNSELISPHFVNIIGTTFKCINHFESSICYDFAKLLISAFNLNNDLTIETITICLNSQEFIKLRPEEVNIIVKFLKIVKTKENDIKILIQDLINISKGLDVVDLMTYEMKISFFERNIKKGF